MIRTLSSQFTKTEIGAITFFMFSAAVTIAQPNTIYENTFDAGGGSLSGFSTFGRFSGSAQVTGGQLELVSDWAVSSVGVSLKTTDLPGFSSALNGTSGLLEWTVNVSNQDGDFNSGFFFVPVGNNFDLYSTSTPAQGYALRGGGLVGNRMTFSRFYNSINQETVLIDVPDAFGLAPLPEKGAVRITFEPQSSTWSVYMNKGSSYSDPKAASELLGTVKDDTYTHLSEYYLSMGGETAGTAFFDNLSITIVPEPSALCLASVGLCFFCWRMINVARKE